MPKARHLLLEDLGVGCGVGRSCSTKPERPPYLIDDLIHFVDLSWTLLPLTLADVTAIMAGQKCLVEVREAFTTVQSDLRTTRSQIMVLQEAQQPKLSWGAPYPTLNIEPLSPLRKNNEVSHTRVAATSTQSLANTGALERREGLEMREDLYASYERFVQQQRKFVLTTLSLLVDGNTQTRNVVDEVFLCRYR